MGLVRRAFVEPVRAGRHHRRVVRLLTDRIADPETARVAERALNAADAVLAEAPGAFAYAVLADPAGLTVRVAGRRLPQPPSPWRADGPGVWQAPPDSGQ
ncbi:hypothetical protein SSCG_05854, partial [Streptomyces clavuligerus]